LLKLSRSSTRWHRRWFVLLPDRLLGFRAKMGANREIRDDCLLYEVSINGQSSIVELDDETVHMYRMCLETSSKRLQLAASSAQEQSRWVQAIRKQVCKMGTQPRAGTGPQQRRVQYLYS
jgi:hypothetical protein